jgi:hypothetical protein
MHERLSQFLAVEQLSPTRFADVIHVQRSGVSHILAGRNKPGADFLEKFINRFPSVNIEWFLTGKGKMYKEMTMQDLFSASAPTPVAEPTATEQPPTETTKPPEAPPAAHSAGKTVEKVIIFYADKTFDVYLPTS